MQITTLFSVALTLQILCNLLRNCKGQDVPTLVSDGPVSGWVGSSVTLSVQLSPPINVSSSSVHWKRKNESSGSFIYILYYNQLSHLSPEYNWRASLVGNLEKGNVSMQLNNLTVKDNGQYTCFIQHSAWCIEININLTVKAMGSIPLTTFSNAAQSGLVNVTCESYGWYPQPTVMWRNNKGEVLIEKSSDFRVYTSGNNTLINVSSWVLVSPSDSEWVSCSVGLSDQDRRESRIRPHTYTDIQMTKPWKTAFIILVSGIVVVGLGLGLGLFLLYKKGMIKIVRFRHDTPVENETIPLKDETSPLTERDPHQRSSPRNIPVAGTRNDYGSTRPPPKSV